MGGKRIECLQLGVHRALVQGGEGHNQVFLVVTNVDALAGSLCSLKIWILLRLRGIPYVPADLGPAEQLGAPLNPVKWGRHLSSLPAKPLVGMTKWGVLLQTGLDALTNHTGHHPNEFRGQTGHIRESK